MSTAFSDFGPLTERRRMELQQQQRRRFMVADGGASVVLILIVMGGAAVAYNASANEDDDSSESSSSPSDGGSGSNLVSVSKSIKVMCAQTDYKDACEKSLAKSANASASSPKDIVRAAVAVIGDAIRQAFQRSGMIISDDPRVKATVADCKEIYEHARDDLARTLKGIDVDGMDGVTKRGYQLRVWLSAVIAYQETCIDGFPEGDIKTKMTGAMESGKELTSNALAILEKASTFLVALNINIPAASHRRLLVVDEEIEKQPMVNHSGGDTPLWVNRQVRELKGMFQSSLPPNVVVAKDGSGKFKTINDALNAMPKTYTGRYVIDVKEGVYEEYVTITKAMANVTMYGDGAMRMLTPKLVMAPTRKSSSAKLMFLNLGRFGWLGLSPLLAAEDARTFRYRRSARRRRRPELLCRFDGDKHQCALPGRDPVRAMSLAAAGREP